MRRVLALAAALIAAGGGTLAALDLEQALQLHRQGRLVEAVAAYRRIAAAAPPDAELATAHSAACAALNDLGRFAEALAECDRAERLRRALGGGTALADTLNNRGLSLDALGRPREAEAAFQEALAIYRAAGSAEDQAFVLSNLATLAIGRGDFGTALERLDAAETLARAAEREPWAAEELRVGRINRAVTLERLGAYREAMAELRAAPPDPGASSEEAALRSVNVAVLYRNLGDPWRALAELDEAERRLSGHPDPSIGATIELNRGLVALLGLDQPERARAAFLRALRRAQKSGDRKEEGRTLVALGRAELALGDPGAADAAFESALATTAATESAETRWTALAGRARAALARGDGAAADERFAEAIEAVEAVGAGVASGALREGLIEDQRELYAGAVERLAARGEAGDNRAALEALALAERARARELLDALAAGARSDPLDAVELAEAAHRFAPALVFFAGTERLWRFRLDADGGVGVADVGAARATLADARAVHDDLARGRHPPRERLARLGERLLPTALPAGERLRIVPDSVLFYLPFDLLPLPDGRTLGEARAVVYAPSLSTLARLDSRARATPRWDLLAFADPAPSEARGTGSTSALLAARFGLPPLPGARAEAEGAASRLGPRSLVEVGPRATESAFRLRTREGAHVLLLSAHTLVDERIEGGVALFLAPGDGEDGALSAGEIARLPLAVDLAVLSGCRTALAGHRNGRSMATLAGALLGAGARGVVATLWEVDDADARVLVDGFFWELARGVEPAEALRRAKRRLAEDPRWAGRVDANAFVLIGEPPPLEARRGALAWAVPAGLLLAAALALTWRARAR